MGILRSDGTARQFANDDERDRSFDGTVGDEEIRDALHGAIDRFFDHLGGSNRNAGADAALGGTSGTGSETAPAGLADVMRRLDQISGRVYGEWDTNRPGEIAAKLGIAVGDNPSPMSGVGRCSPGICRTAATRTSKFWLTRPTGTPRRASGSSPRRRNEAAPMRCAH